MKIQVNYKNPWVIGGAAACGAAAAIAAGVYFVYNQPGELINKAVEKVAAPIFRAIEALPPFTETVITEHVVTFVLPEPEPNPGDALLLFLVPVWCFLLDALLTEDSPRRPHAHHPVPAPHIPHQLHVIPHMLQQGEPIHRRAAPAA